ncbi:MAG: hypothetical protein NT154_07625 [Verrucomicrobia bacterium]|nr:hypothetical protein [Verrucomicrobiota bacterium]
MLHGLKADYAKALELLDKSLPVLRQAAPSATDWQFMVTGEADDEHRPDSWKAFFGQEILTADLLTAKASAAAGDYARAAGILCDIVHDDDLLTRILPEDADRTDVLRAVEHDLEALCRALGGKLEEPVDFNETLPSDAQGKLLSDIYYGLCLCYSAFDRPEEAVNARARHNLFWSALGQTSPFLDV